MVEVKVRKEEDRPELVKNECWVEVDEPVGIVSKEPIYCPMCKAREPSIKVEMRMRRSRIHTVADVRIANLEKGARDEDPAANRPYAMDIAYKCPRCDFYTVFGVPTTITHAQKIIELRGNKVDYVLPEEIWLEDDAVARRLERWGYW